MTGNDQIGLSPAGAKYIQEFEPIAKKYSNAMAELEYVIEIEKYLTAIDEDENEFGISGASPMPSKRKSRCIEIEQILINTELSNFAKKNRDTSDADLTAAAQFFFYEKAFNQLQQTQSEYGNDHRILIIAGRMLGEFLMPGSKSNVLDIQE
jgi:hypothetical protein